MYARSHRKHTRSDGLQGRQDSNPHPRFWRSDEGAHSAQLSARRVSSVGFDRLMSAQISEVRAEVRTSDASWTARLSRRRSRVRAPSLTFPFLTNCVKLDAQCSRRECLARPSPALAPPLSVSSAWISSQAWNRERINRRWRGYWVDRLHESGRGGRTAYLRHERRWERPAGVDGR